MKKPAFIYKRLVLICVLLLFTTLLTSCKKKIENITMPENEIILIQRYVNYADGYQDRGYFIDTKGNVYDFDFSDISFPEDTEQDIMDQLEIIHQSEQPRATLDVDAIQKVYNYGMKIDPNSELVSNHVGFDMGEDQTIFRNTETKEQILCYETGDSDVERDDPNAKKLVKVFQKEIEKQVEKQLK